MHLNSVNSVIILFNLVAKHFSLNFLSLLKKVLLISSNLMRKDNRKTWSTVDKVLVIYNV